MKLNMFEIRKMMKLIYRGSVMYKHVLKRFLFARVFSKSVIDMNKNEREVKESLNNFNLEDTAKYESLNVEENQSILTDLIYEICYNTFMLMVNFLQGFCNVIKSILNNVFFFR